MRCRESIADIDPHFRHLSADILRLSGQAMRRTRFKKSDGIVDYDNLRRERGDAYPSKVNFYGKLLLSRERRRDEDVEK